MDLGALQTMLSSWLAVAAAALGLAGPAAQAPWQGYGEGELVLIGSTLGGTVEAVTVRRGQRVEAGGALFTLDRALEEAQEAEAAARLEAAQARLENLRKGRRQPEIDALKAQKGQAEAQLRLAQISLDRQRRLTGSTAALPERLDEAQAEVARLRARIAEVASQIALAELPGREDEIAAAEAEAAAAVAARAQAAWRIAQKAAAAPAAGLVFDVYFRAGEAVSPGQPVVALLPPQNRLVRFFVPQAERASLTPGRRVLVACDGCGAPIPAAVAFVSPRVEYTPPVLYGREGRQRLMFLAEARPLERAELVNPGQPVEVRPAPQ